MSSAFPQSFLWGTATAAYQIEGGVAADGRGLSIWDTFCATSGRIADGSSGEVACDHYHRIDEDLDLLAGLGVGAYRFSVAWSRIQPDPATKINQGGVDFYRRVLDGLRERGIRPFVTLYHWDLPQWLQDRGGWTQRETAWRFADYAGLLQEALGEGITDYLTVNEPWVAAWLGYGWGDHAPGHSSFAEALAATHHLLLGHGLAAQRLRAQDSAASVGLALSLSPVRAVTDGPQDIEAMRLTDGHYNRLFLDPVLRGRYPTEVLQRYLHLTDFAFIRDGDLDEIAVPVDFLGVNYYRRAHVEAAPPASPELLAGTEVSPDGVQRTAMDWPIEPDGLTELLLRLTKDYGPIELYVTENGAAFDDTMDPGGSVHDHLRIQFLRSHVAAAAQAIDAGVDLRGYFQWSLLDNFEWTHGYTKRFGLVHVDYASLRRTPKLSYGWYRDLIAANGEFS